MGTILLHGQILNNISYSAGIFGIPGNTFFGSGCSFVDFNNDGFDDLTIGTEHGDSLLFYLNNGNSTFTKLPAFVNHTGLARQVLWVDIDNDDDLDLYVNTSTFGSSTSQNRMYKNNGNSTFTDITASCGIHLQNDDSFGAAFRDIDKDGDLDLYISNRDTDYEDILYRNNGNATFTDITATAGIILDFTPDFCAAFFDFDNDKDVDLYTIVDTYGIPNKLYKNNGLGSFTNVAPTYGADIAIGAMNAGIADYNNDGFFDIYITNTTEGNQLLYNDEGNYFVDVAFATGTAIYQYCWGASFLDVDNDKDLDLYVCSQNSSPNNRNRLLKNRLEQNNDLFVEYTSNGIPGDTMTSFVSAVGDLNNDGKPDICVINGNFEPIMLYKNNINTSNNYVKIKLKGTTSNKNAIGSLIKIYDGDSVQYRFTHCGQNYLAQNSMIENIGLRNNTKIDSLHITWPSGITSKYYNLGVNQLYYITEGNCLNHA